MHHQFRRFRPVVAGAVIWTALTTAGSNQPTAPAELAVLVDGLGTYSRPISPASPAAQRFFDQGLRLVYVRGRFERAWKGADVTLKASVF